MKTVLYCRVSTVDQTVEHQRTQAHQNGFTPDLVLADHGVSGVSTQQSFDQSSERTMVLRRRFLGSIFQHGIDPNSDLRSLFAARYKAAPSFCNSTYSRGFRLRMVTLAAPWITRPEVRQLASPSIVTITNKVESQDQNWGDRGSHLNSIRPAIQNKPPPLCADVLSIFYAKAYWQTPMRHVQRTVRHRFGWKQFCCKACLDTYLACTTREAHRSRHWLEFLARKE
jgi:hypothetical protein